MTKSEDLNVLNDLFVKWDVNNDGFLSYEELKREMSNLTSILQMSEDDVVELMRNADSNGDGYIDYNEFITATSDKQKLINGENLVKIFAMIDTNSDGSISKDELESVFGSAAFDQNGSIWQEILNSVDTDNDGQISYEEFNDHMVEVIRRKSQ